MKRLGWIAVLTAVAVLAATARGAAPPPHVTFNIDCVVGWQGCYRPLDWTPVHFRVGSSSQEPLGYTLVVSGEQSDRATMTISHRFVLTPGETLPIPLVTKIAGGSYSCRAWLLDSGGHKVWEKEYTFYDPERGRASLVPVNLNDCLIGVHRFGSAGDRSDFGLRELGKNAHSRFTGDLGDDQGRGNQVSGQVYVRERIQKELPVDWTGYESLDLFILYDPDWTAMTALQVEAIRQWVSGGGRLLIILGSSPLPAKHPLAQMLPLTVGEARRVTLAQPTKEDWGFEGEGPATVTAWTLEAGAKGDWGWRLSDDALWAVGPVGFGKVGVLAFDPAAFAPRTVVGERPDDASRARAVRNAANWAGFWVKRAGGLLSQRTLAAGQQSENNNAYNMFASESGSSVNTIMTYLLNIREMQPISIIWIVLLLLGLAVVIGPFDYLVLKRRDRLPLTWMTFTIYIVAFSVLAYYGVKALRSGPTQFRAVSVVDAVDGNPYAWSACYSGIFANESADYPLNGLAPGQWWSTLAPHWGRESYGDPNPLRQASQGMACVQEDGANLPTYLPINIWSMQCLMTEGAVPAMPLSATVERSAEGITARIANLSDVPIRGGYIRLKDDRAVMIGAIPARGSREVKGRPASAPSSWRMVNSEAYVNTRFGYDSESQVTVTEPPTEAMYAAPGTIRRTRAMQERLQEGAAVVVVEYENAPCAYGLKDRSFTAVHTQCARLVVIPTERHVP